MASLFTRMINGEVPCHKIFEDENHFAILDIKPINPGHALVIPKQEIDYIFDMKDNALGSLMVSAKKVAAAIKKEVICEKVGVMVAGLEVRHVHIHLIPILAVRDLNFANAKPVSNEELAAMAEKIRRHFH
jgi:histidine triad (HIT) family protein